MNNTISRYQLFCALLAIQSGGRYVAMPREVATFAANDAWISVMLACAGVALVAAAIAYMSSLFPNETVVQYMPKILGKYGAFFFNLMVCFAIIFMLMFQTKAFSDSTHIFVLPHTPLIVIGGSLILCSLYIVLKGFHPLMYVTQIALVPFILIHIIITALCFQNGDIEEIKPLLGNGIMPVIRGIIPAMVCTGPELIIGMIYTTIQTKKHIMKVVLISGSITLFRIDLMVLSCIMSLGPGEICQLIYPGATIFKEVSIPMFIITERLEAVLMMVLIPFNFLATALCIFFASVILNQVFGLRKQWISQVVVALMSLVLVMLPIDALQFSTMTKYWHWYIAFVVFVLLPTPVLIAHFTQRARRNMPC